MMRDRGHLHQGIVQVVSNSTQGRIELSLWEQEIHSSTHAKMQPITHHGGPVNGLHAGSATLAAYCKSVREFGSRLKGAAKDMLEARLAEASKPPQPAPAPAASSIQQPWNSSGLRPPFCYIPLVA